uniref:RE44040p n=1 Tax=Drosophila melanogaster TaxID=7227 RepID=Q6NNV3_DROME|nr:RE44040p [Drosophila melanogaster]
MTTQDRLVCKRSRIFRLDALYGGDHLASLLILMRSFAFCTFLETSRTPLIWTRAWANSSRSRALR